MFDEDRGKPILEITIFHPTILCTCIKSFFRSLFFQCIVDVLAFVNNKRVVACSLCKTTYQDSVHTLVFIRDQNISIFAPFLKSNFLWLGLVPIPVLSVLKMLTDTSSASSIPLSSKAVLYISKQLFKACSLQFLILFQLKTSAENLCFPLGYSSTPASMKTDQPVLSKIIIDKKRFLIQGVQEWFCHLFHLIITALLIRGSNRELLFYFQTRKKCPMTTVKKKKNAIGCFSIK